MSLDLGRVRADFPALAQRVGGRPVVYLDNACMTPKPEPVLRAMEDYYRGFPACHGRAAHRFGRLTTEAYDRARGTLASFIGAQDPTCVVFTRNATEGINLVARGSGLQAGDAVLCSEMEHNSNLLPWLDLRRRSGVQLRRFSLRADGSFDEAAFEKVLTSDVRLVSVFHTSNVTGASLPIPWIASRAHAIGALLLLDATQAAACGPLDVAALDVDLCVLSMHKAFGPTGTGLLWGRRGLLETLSPLLYGGEMVADVDDEIFQLSPVPQRFEAGLQDYAGVLGAAAAATWLQACGLRAVPAHLAALNLAASEGLSAIPGLRILGPAEPARRHGIVNFILDGIPSEHVARVLDEGNNVMVRAGVHCSHGWYRARGLPPSVRVSFALYNSIDEAGVLVRAVAGIARHFR